MKIVIYSRTFLPLPGGVQTIVLALARGLSEWRSDESTTGPLHVTVVTRTSEQAAEEESWPFRLVRCPGILQLWKLFRSADIIHVAGPALLPMIIGLALRKPVFVEHHGCQAASPHGLLFFEPTKTVCPGYCMSREDGKCLKCTRTEE